ncbi:CopG family antitoxin [Desulfoscipio geothermicus]|uniref:CopG antitoxin of type II toxin-antitoxin system n=1 Tax=Desulfoscipio geothermicus DSM 3669 TaxID=1121426 RepID=A0A1I6ELR0_9FIRM|nr:CopG family antitoxin [Desulfoscipio geothermicus]SFR18458.1 CopG antitoxin of type II toxin-antitoxin system [Desulfoscipio geothermicus DSM 3669]
MTKSKHNIPDFKTIEEAREFWEIHSLADFADDLEVARDVKFVKRNNLVVSLDLEKEDMKRLRMLANKKGVGLTDLITHWIKEQLRSV